jgi:hypothetical protein
MIHFGNGVVEFVRKTRLPRFTPLPLFLSIPVSGNKVVLRLETPLPRPDCAQDEQVVLLNGV